MTKRRHDALGRVLMAEIEDRLPFQSKARVYAELHEEGMLEPYSAAFGLPPFRVKVHGWALTERGRLLYCEACK